MMNVDDALRRVMDVFQSMTGRPIAPSGTELPPEVDAVSHVEARYRVFQSLLDGRDGNPVAGPAEGVATAWAPAVDVYEHERELRFEADLPGVPVSMVRVSVNGDWLFIVGERPNGHARTARYGERAHGMFAKLLALPTNARRAGIEARLRDGVLTVTIPTSGRADRAAEVHVDVKSG